MNSKQPFFTSDDKEGCVDSIQWLRGKYADISSEYEDLTDLFMWGNNNGVNDRKGFINDSMARNGACRQFIKNIARFDRLAIYTNLSFCAEKEFYKPNH